MKKILVAPGAFKNSLKARQVAAAMTRGLRRSGIAADLISLPIADGGNDTLDVMLAAAASGRSHSVTVRGPLGHPVKADYGILDYEGQPTAVIEMALASGLELLNPKNLAATKTTTYGTGQLMGAALEAGARRFIVGLGGSATVDGGFGCMQALGVKLMDANDRPVIQPGGGALSRIAKIDASGLSHLWQECEVIIAADVDNPALGERGAAAVFGPQKGATPAEVEKLEAALTNAFMLVNDQLGVDVRTTPGGGAAGAFAAGLMAFLGARVESGIELVLRHCRFDEHLAGADLVVTGEGRMDEQTVGGKGPFGVALRAREAGVPTVALVGGLDADDALLHEAGLAAVMPVVTRPMELAEAILDAEALVERAALRLGYLLQIGLG